MLIQKCDQCKTEVLVEQLVEVQTPQGNKQVCQKCKYHIQLNENSNLLKG